MTVIIDGSAGITTPGETNTGNLSVAGTTTLTTPLPVASGGTGGSATPTAGGVVYGTGSAQAVTAAGTSGQVLTSAGSSTPTWTTPSAGAMTLISTKTANNTSQTVDFTGLSGYDKYSLIFENLKPASLNQILMQVGTGAGPTYITTGYYLYLMYGQNGSATTGSGINNSSYMYVAGVSGGVNPSNGGASGQFTITGMTSGQNTMFFGTSGDAYNSTGNFEILTSAGQVLDTTTKTAIRIGFIGTSNAASGSVSLYGISS